MKIIKPGDPGRLDTTRRFECAACGCVFEANATEYIKESDFRNGIFCRCACPTCRRQVTTDWEVRIS